MSRVVVVGAGPGGLASAMLLARAGLDVTVLERQPHVGGRTSTHGAGGYSFDLGPTFFLYPRVIEEIFRACGHELRDEVEMVRLDPQYHLVFGGGGSMKATPDIGRMEREIASISPADSLTFRRFMEDNRLKMARFRPVLENPFHGIRDVLKWPMVRLLPLLRPWLSLEQELGRYFTDPRIRLAFSFQSKYLGMSPFNCPSLFSILSFLEYENGVYHPMGGCASVSRAMARLARDAGVDIRLGEAVESLEFEGRKIVAARTAGGRYECDRMVVNADFAHAMTRLVPDKIRANWNNKKIESRRYSCSTFMLYLGVEGSFPDIEHHTIYMAKDYESNLKDIESRHVLSEDPSFYVHNPSRIDSSLAPRGHSSLYILVPVSHQHANIDWKVEAPRFREKVLDQVRKIGLPDLRPLIRHERMITPADWEHDQAIYRGATFNLAHNLGQMLHLRPGNRFADLDGVYLTGGGTHPGSGLPVIYESARISSRLLLQDLGLPYDHCVAEDNRARPASLAGRLFGARESRREKHQLTA